jgi:hypothetical protein
MLPSGEKVVIVPVPFIAENEVVVALTPPAVVVGVVLESCARAVPSASAQATPAAKILVNLFCFMFVLWFG